MSMKESSTRYMSRLEWEQSLFEHQMTLMSVFINLNLHVTQLTAQQSIA
jgi:hypothetical protein